jgi:hypothetical protein
MSKDARRAKAYRGEVDRIAAVLDELKGHTEAERAGTQGTLERYLYVLEAKCREVDSQLDEVDPSSEVDMDLVAEGVREARQRLRIARRAIRAPRI